MFVVFNIVLIVLVLFIAYWWANQGLFSALLHLLCVIVAGGITFAFWEPLAYGLLIRGSGFDDYALGVAFVGLFAISLFVLRLAADRLAPANVDVPHWANLAFGGVAGAGAGVLTLGIVLIGLGFVQSSNEILGWRGVARSMSDGRVKQVQSVWLPAHRLTSEFYGFLSVTSLGTARPLQAYYPELWKQASLVRDSYSAGRGKLTLLPSAAAVQGLYVESGPRGDSYFVRLRFEQGAIDFGEQLTVSAAQLRLIGATAGRAEAPVIHPTAWIQDGAYYLFDHVSHVISSRPGQEFAEAIVRFDVPAGFDPRFIQVRGTRYAMPRQVETLPPRLAGAMARATGGDAATGPTGEPIDAQMDISNDLRQIQISTNLLPAGIQEIDRYLSSGYAEFQRGGPRPSRELSIRGIYEPEGTRCVRVVVVRNGPTDIYLAAARAGEDAQIKLLDAEGNLYTAVGYVYTDGPTTRVKLDPTRRLRTIDDFPVLPTSGTQQLELLFYVTEGVTVTGLVMGDLDIGSCHLLVEPKG